MSNLINTIQQTMSSIEIANLTGKQHKHVMRDIRELNEGYEKLYLPKIGLKHRISDLGGGRQRKDPYFELTRMQTFDLLTGYSVELRIKVNRRWEELEALTHIKMPPLSQCLWQGSPALYRVVAITPVLSYQWAVFSPHQKTPPALLPHRRRQVVYK